MALAKHLKLELSLMLLMVACLVAVSVAPLVALFERDWLYAFLLAVPLAFGNLPHRVRPWTQQARMRVQTVYAVAVGILGLHRGHVWLAVAGVLAPQIIVIAALWFMYFVPQLFSRPPVGLPRRNGA